MNQSKPKFFKNLIFPFLLLFGGVSAAISMNHFDHRASVVHADAVTDLTGCTWVASNSLTVPSDYNMHPYSVSFVSNNTEYNLINMGLQNGVPKFFYDTTLAYGGTNGPWDASWKNENYKTIQITGGNDSKNTTFITWLQNNGTLTSPEPVDPVAVTSVELDKDAAEVSVGSTVTLTANVLPTNATNKNVTWSTSDINVATVAEGVVTGVAEGSATITVTTADGNKTATCVITVSASSSIDVDEGLYTTIIVKDTRKWNFRTLWLDNFEYATGYNQTQRNLFIASHYVNEIDNWDAEAQRGNRGRGYHYDSNGVNLATGEKSGTYTFQLPAWITDCSIQVENNQHKRYVGTIDDLAEKCILKNNTWGDPVTSGHIGDGLGKTITVDVKETSECNSGAYVSISDDQSYSDQITINRYFLKSDGAVKAADQVACYKYYFGNVGKVAVDGYATNNKWYIGTDYSATDEYDTSNILTSTDPINLVAKYEVGSNDSSLEIRFTRQTGDGAAYVHTWNEGGSGASRPGYEMTWLLDNEYGQAVFSWSPSFDEPLYGNIILNNNGYQTAELVSPSTSKWYYSGDWHDVPTMDIYLYDYDNVYDGNVDLSLSRYGTSFAEQVEATQMIDVATNGLIYKATINNRYNRVVFSNNGQNATDYLTPTGNYCYVKATSDIERKNSWWDNINYVFAHNFSQHTMMMDKIPTSDHSVTQYCSDRYNDAKAHFNALMASGYGKEVLKELNNNFADAMQRFAAWASANGEAIDNTNGTIYTNNAILFSVDTNNTMLILVVVSISTLAAVGFFLLRRKQR